MTRRGWLLGGLAVWFCLAAGAARAADPESLSTELSEVHRRITERLAAVRAENKLDAQQSLLIIQQEASPIFNWQKLARAALGKSWKKTDEVERAAIAKSFRRLLEKTYAKVLAAYSGQTITVVEAKAMADDKIKVAVEISDGDKSALIEYLFGPDDNGEYRIDNVKVEGVSLVANYRRQFSSVVRKDGIAGLIEKLDLLSRR